MRHRLSHIFGLLLSFTLFLVVAALASGITPALADTSPAGLKAAQQACSAQGLTPGTDQFKQCVKQQLKLSGGDASSSGPSASKIAAKICQNLQAKLGDSFTQKFSSLEDCQGKMLSVGQGAISSCQGNTGDALKSCIQQQVRNQVKAEFGGNGTGNGTTSEAVKTAREACKAQGLTAGTDQFKQCVKQKLGK